MTKQDKPWVVEEKTKLGMLPESSHTSRLRMFTAINRIVTGTRFKLTELSGNKRTWILNKKEETKK